MPQARKPAWQSRLKDDRKYTLREIKKASDRSLIERLLEIQNYSSTTLRSFEWAQTATCLRVTHDLSRSMEDESEPDLQEVTIDLLHPSSRYIAVSYCDKPSKAEPATDREYKILRKSSKRPELSEVRAYVLDRVIEFSGRHGIDSFWIDDDCLGETNRMDAINGMDVVYRKATKCVGLLSSTLDTDGDVRVLDLFLQGRFINFCGKSNEVILDPRIEAQQLRKLCNLLQKIFSDKWWSRCWIFQEAYCGGSKMMLLMPCKARNFQLQGLQCLVFINQDVQLCLRSLQEQATLFSLAMDRGPRQISAAQWSVLRKQLENGRRYDLIHECEATRRARFSKTPMSASIVADVCKRNLFDKADLPAVIANCCDYTRRVVVPARLEERLSLSLVVLALFLLNGDFLNVRSRTKPHSAKTICEILCDTSFRQTTKLEKRNQLTILKRRRWPKVEMCQNFIRTWGHIWTLDRFIRIKVRIFVNGPTSKPRHSLDKFEKICLGQLIRQLGPKQRLLSSHLRSLVQELSEIVDKTTQRREWRLLMAQEVCRAIKKGIPLLLGRPFGEGQYHAVFVSPWRSPRRPITGLTSWEAGERIGGTQSLRAIEKYMSFRAQSVVPPTRTHELWMLKDWLNGLCFFQGLPQQEILLPWPDFLQ